MVKFYVLQIKMGRMTLADVPEKFKAAVETELNIGEQPMVYRILDISKYQPNVDYAATAKDIDGVILRIGLTYWGAQNMGKDEYFEQHYAGFKAVGCPVGVYYYSAADSVAVAEKEADFCLSLLKGKQFELPIYYDVENNQRQGSLSKALLTQIVDVFCSKVEKAGFFVGFYASTSWLTNKMDTAYLSSKYTLWKADYRTAYDKTIPCDMHQYTSGGAVAGINGRVDLSNCYVDFEKIIKEKGLNGFEKEIIERPVETESEIENLSKEASRLIIGAMSKGDVLTMSNYLDSLEIKFEVTNEGYIITNYPVTYGDKINIKNKADDIGNIAVKDYVPNIKNPEQCAECDLLKAKIAELERDFEAEVEFKRGYQEQLETANNKLLSTTAELLAVNKALSATRESVDNLTVENADLKTKINKIKELIV